MSVTLDNTFGALFTGVIISSILYGITCIQTWYYYDRYPSDRWYIKLLVLGVFVSDTCHQAMISHTAYKYLVTDIDYPLGHTQIVWSLIVEVYFNGFTAFAVQCFMAARVCLLSHKSWVATGSVMILVIGEFVMILIYSAKAIYFETFTQLITLKALSMSINAVAAAADVLISVFLCFLLERSRTGFRRSDTMINKLIVYSINTGLLTSLCAIASLVSISAWPGTFIYIAFYFCLGRLYCNSLLGTLNARQGLRNQNRSDELSLSLQGVQKSNPSADGSSKCATNNISIKIDTIHERSHDEYATLHDVKSEAV